MQNTKQWEFGCWPSTHTIRHFLTRQQEKMNCPVCSLFSIVSVSTSKFISFSCMCSWGVWPRLFLLSVSILSLSQFLSWISRDCKAQEVLKVQWNGCSINLIYVKQLSWCGWSNKKLSKLKEHEAFEPEWLKSDNIRSNSKCMTWPLMHTVFLSWKN